MQKIYTSIYKSLIRAVNDLIEEIRVTVDDHELCEYRSWENRADEDQLKRVPLLGLSGMTFKESGQLWEIRCGITLSTVDDTNLFAEAEIIDLIHSRLGEGKTMALRDLDTGEEITQLVVTDFDTMPMEQTQLRNYRTIGLELRRTAASG